MATKATPEDLDDIGEPLCLKLSLLETITDDFSKELIIGTGAFGTVYKGVLGDGAFVAVKKLHEYHAIEDKTFLQEAKCMMSIKHPNIVQFVGYCAESRSHMVPEGGEKILVQKREKLFCFEYLCNGSLRKHLTEEGSCGLQWHICYQIIKGICQGLHYLHLVGHIVHLDLKPENILLDDDMVPKIADFGLARLLDKGESRLITENVAGTLGYMAPEYLFHGAITFKSDIYSLGVIIREIVMGRNSGATTENALESWTRRLEQDYSSEIYRRIQACIEISQRCTEPKPEKRPTIKEILCELEETEAGGCRSVVDDNKEQCTGGTDSLSRLMQGLKLMATGRGQGPSLVAPGDSKPADRIFWLDTRSNTRCYMLSSRSLTIGWKDDPRYWEWTARSDSRFAECAVLREVCYLGVIGVVPREDLSLGARYAVYLVYKLASGAQGLEGTQASSIWRLDGTHLDAGDVSLRAAEHGGAAGVTYPTARHDGWMELKLGELAIDDEALGENPVKIYFRDPNESSWKSGLIVEGMEFRPSS